MAEAAPSALHLRRGSDMPQKERFFRYFRQEITGLSQILDDLQEQMGRLGDTALVGGEQKDAVEHLVAGIARLGSEVHDASSYLPAYDQRTYAEAIKGLREKLDETRASFAPRTRFAFKSGPRKNPSAVSLSDAAEIAAQKRGLLHTLQTTSSESSFVHTPTHLQSPDRDSSPAPLLVPPPTAVDESPKDASASDSEKKEVTTSSTISIAHESSAHIILPSSTSHVSKPCSLTSLEGCVIAISAVSPQVGAPFAGLTISNVKGSLLVCGIVSGPAHITGMEDSVIVVTCRQFRMHECKNVDVYLSCSSRPIIEGCEAIRFAELPGTYHVTPIAAPPLRETTNATTLSTSTDPNSITKTTTQQSLPPAKYPFQSPADLWSQIDDFKWLKSTPSPNWSLLPPEDIVPDDTWRKVVLGGRGWSLEEILRATRVLK